MSETKPSPAADRPEPIALELPSPDSFGGRLLGVLQLPAPPPDGGPSPAVVICHGFKGFLDWGFFPPLADLLVERGFAALRFNYSGSGMRPGDELVTDTDAFRRNTFSLEKVETLRVLEAVTGRVAELAPGRIDGQRLGLLGHSRGGAAAILAAAEAGDRLKALVTWSAIASFDRYGGDQRKQWREQGSLPVVNGRTGQELELGIELLDDAEGNREALDLEAAAARLRAPWLIVHGVDDETVPVDEARTLHRAAGGEPELVEVAEGSHTFGARHPFAGPTRPLIQALNATQTWFRRHL
jgi:pimeloyl-ACP methyl ester carboxylesterase